MAVSSPAMKMSHGSDRRGDGSSAVRPDAGRPKRAWSRRQWPDPSGRCSQAAALSDTIDFIVTVEAGEDIDGEP